MVWLLLSGCLEKTTGVFIPLSADFTNGHEEASTDPGTGDGVWPTLKDPRVHIKGSVTSDDKTAPVQIDVSVDDPDTSNKSGQIRVGALHLDNGPGEFEFYAPVDVVLIHLQAFQDPVGDGPSEDDPFARTDVTIVDAKDPDAALLALQVGARGAPDGGGQGDPNHPGTGDPNHPSGSGDPNNPGGDPNAGGGQGPQPSGPPGGEASAFPGVTDLITLSGTVSGPSSPMVVDFFKIDPAGQGGRTHLFKLDTDGGAWSAKFPRGFGQIQIEAFVDPQKDGPTQGDPMVSCPCNPLTIGDADVTAVVLAIPG